MSKFVKSQWHTQGDHMRLSMPIAKVDREQRLVSGFATLDNVDSQGDVVTSEASTKAFSRARGNLREMHQPIAAGRIVDFREDEFMTVDPATGETKFYRGIFVTAYVSKGAEATWEKVLDGTLSGFSIGGNILDSDHEYDPELGKSVRFIKDYELIELSLVDNPANQLANVFSITKSATGSVTVKGMAVDTEIENVFYCREHNTVKASDEDSATCVESDCQMENIGWFETGGDRAEKVRNVVNKFLGLTDANAAESTEGEGGVDVSENAVEKSEATDEVVEPGAPSEEEGTTEVVEENPEAQTAETVDADAEQVADAEGEGTEEVDETNDESDVISKKIDELHEAVNTSLEQTRTETAEKVSALEKQIADLQESFTAKTSELESQFSEFGNKLEAEKSRLAELEKALEVVNSSEAVKKSGESDSPETVQKTTTWNGAFSVDNLLR